MMLGGRNELRTSTELSPSETRNYGVCLRYLSSRAREIDGCSIV